MTLADFRRETADLSGDTEIHVLSPWGDVEDAAWVTHDDLAEDDPARAEILPGHLLLTGEAD